MKPALRNSAIWASVGLNVAFIALLAVALVAPQAVVRQLIHHRGAPRLLGMGGRGGMPKVIVTSELERWAGTLELSPAQLERAKALFDAILADGDTTFSLLRDSRLAMIEYLADHPEDAAGIHTRWAEGQKLHASMVTSLVEGARKAALDLTPEQRRRLKEEIAKARAEAARQ